MINYTKFYKAGTIKPTVPGYMKDTSIKRERVDYTKFFDQRKREGRK